MLAFYFQMLDTDEERSKFEELYQKYKEVLYHFSYEILQDPQYAEDAVQDAFLSLAQNMSKIENRTRIQIRNYLLIIARNASFRIYRKTKHEIRDDRLFDKLIDPLNLEQEVEKQDSRTRLLILVKKLDMKFSDVLVLRYFYGLKNKEIAAALKISVDNVKTRLCRGKSALKELLEEDYRNER